jgi:pimeloyl-ACP methyl ester carboxylesterase
MAIPVTAILRASQQPCTQANQSRVVSCVLEMHDPLVRDHVDIAHRLVPLETDLTTPLGYFLDSPEFRPAEIATWGLLNPNQAASMRGLYMLEAYDPNKIPVLMVHGLWSSPETWTQMVNDLRSSPEVRSRYQFWSYLYPTGQPFWISATEMRDDLARARSTVDPNHRHPALDQMVLVGHSMGGLVSRMQTLDSGERFWRVLSDQPFDELEADPETRETLARTVFFQPNRSIRRVVTMGTPHRGSDFANDYTRWLGRKLIKLPSALVQTKRRIVRDNPGLFRDTHLLTTTTSIDSLSPESPILPVMLESTKAPWVKYHNVVGVLSKRDLLGRISKKGDGVVEYASAHVEDVESEIVVEADHVHVHQHPRSVLELRRILLEHSREMYAEMQLPRQHTAIPATYQMTPGTPNSIPAPAPESRRSEATEPGATHPSAHPPAPSHPNASAALPWTGAQTPDVPAADPYAGRRADGEPFPFLLDESGNDLHVPLPDYPPR